MEMMLLGGEICAKYGIENVINNIYLYNIFIYFIENCFTL